MTDLPCVNQSTDDTMMTTICETPKSPTSCLIDAALEIEADLAFASESVSIFYFILFLPNYVVFLSNENWAV
jgi:hypothetical protein